MHRSRTTSDTGRPRARDVLVVDDEPVVCSAIRRVLEAEGLGVVTVGTSEEALAHPAVADCRLAVCALVLPDGSGIELIRALRARRPGLRVVLITGYATPEQEAAALAAGAAAFLPKPFEESELLHVVREALGFVDAPGAKEKPP